MEKLFKADKQINEYKEIVEAINGGGGKTAAGSQDIKDKKILELAKKNRTLQLQVESLKTKAAKAAEIAIRMKKENDVLESQGEKSPPQKRAMAGTISDGTMSSGLSEMESEKRAKELEKRITKMRNEK